MDALPDDSRDDFADRYAGELERALLERALAGTGSLPSERARSSLAVRHLQRGSCRHSGPA